MSLAAKSVTSCVSSPFTILPSAFSVIFPVPSFSPKAQILLYAEIPPSVSRFSSAKSFPTISSCSSEVSAIVVTTKSDPPWVFTFTSPRIALTVYVLPSCSAFIVSGPCKVILLKRLFSFSRITPVPALTVRPSACPVTVMPACCAISSFARNVTLPAVNAESTRNAPVLFSASATPRTSEFTFRDRLAALSAIFTFPAITGKLLPAGAIPFTIIRGNALLPPVRIALFPTVISASSVTSPPFSLSLISCPAVSTICSGAVTVSSIIISLPALPLTTPSAVFTPPFSAMS